MGSWRGHVPPCADDSRPAGRRPPARSLGRKLLISIGRSSIDPSVSVCPHSISAARGPHMEYEFMHAKPCMNERNYERAFNLLHALVDQISW